MSSSGSKNPPGTPPAAPARGSDHNAEWDADDEQWRHAPVPAKDEKNPLRSIGESIGDVVTGSGPGSAPKQPSGGDDDSGGDKGR